MTAAAADTLCIKISPLVVKPWFYYMMSKFWPLFRSIHPKLAVSRDAKGDEVLACEVCICMSAYSVFFLHRFVLQFLVIFEAKLAD